MKLRKIVTIIEEVYTDGQRPLLRPLRLAAAVAVVDNPFAGVYQEDLSLLSGQYSLELANLLVPKAAETLGEKAAVFGKAALVGYNGELQHGSSAIHTLIFGDALRDAAKGRGVVPSCEKIGAPGTHLDVSLRSATDSGGLAGTDGAYLFSWQISVADAPRPNELMVIAALGNGPRPNSRAPHGAGEDGGQ